MYLNLVTQVGGQKNNYFASEWLADGLTRAGGGEEMRSGTEKRCSQNLQSGHPAWWSADNYSIFPTVNILEARIESNRQRKSEMLKKLKKLYHATLFFLHIVFVFRY